MRSQKDIADNRAIGESMQGPFGEQRRQDLDLPGETPHPKVSLPGTGNEEMTRNRLFLTALLRALSAWPT
jgi:hypothetical protein